MGRTGQSAAGIIVLGEWWRVLQQRARTDYTEQTIRNTLPRVLEGLPFQRAPPKGLEWPTDQALAFAHVGSDLERTHDFGGVVVPTLPNLTLFWNGGDIAAEDMAIVSPYAKQVQLIRSKLSG